MFNSTTYNSKNYNSVRKHTAQSIGRVIGRIVTIGQTEHALGINQNGLHTSAGLNIVQKSNSVMLQ